MLARLVQAIERLIFGHRAAVLGALALVTAVAAVFASRLHMSAGFGKQLPLGHEYTETFVKYKDVLFGANRLIVVVHARQGDIWQPATLKKLNEVTQALLQQPALGQRLDAGGRAARHARQDPVGLLLQGRDGQDVPGDGDGRGLPPPEGGQEDHPGPAGRRSRGD